MPFVHGQQRLGISDYNINSLVNVGDTQTIAVCKIMSYYDEAVTLTSVWTQLEGSKQLPVTILNPIQSLSPNSAVEIFIVANVPNNDYSGNYEGKVQIDASPLNVSSGSPIAWGGTTKVRLTVKYMKPAEFILYNFAVANSSIYEGENLIASVTVANLGEMSGSYTVLFMLDGIAVSTNAVSLSGNQTRTIDYVRQMNETGTHFISVGDMTKEIYVNPRENPSSMPFNVNILLLSLTVGSVTMGTASVYLFMRSKRKEQT